MQRVDIDTEPDWHQRLDERPRGRRAEGVGHGPLIERSDRVAELIAEVAARPTAS